MSLVVRKFRNQQKRRMPIEQEPGYEEFNEEFGRGETIAITTRTPFDDLLEKEAMGGQRDSIVRSRTRGSSRNRVEDAEINRIYKERDAPFRQIATPEYFKKYKDTTRNAV